MRLVLISLAVCALSSPAMAQQAGPGPGAPYSDANAIAAVTPLIPTASGSVPAAPVLNGQTGSGLSFVPANGAQKLIIQTANTTLGADCTWSVTFSQTFTSSSPIVHASVVLSSATQPIPCIVTSRSSAAQSGKCFPGQTTLLTLAIVTTGLTLSPFASTCSAGTAVMVIGREPTQ